jgi:hypothetical protein
MTCLPSVLEKRSLTNWTEIKYATERWNIMKYAIKTLSAGLVMGLLVLSSGTLRAADTELPNVGDLLDAAVELQVSIGDLEASGDINAKQSKSLSKKLDKVIKALAKVDRAEVAVGGEVTVQQQQGGFLGALLEAVEALLDFIRELAQLVLELPPEVVLPIIDAAIELLQGLLGLLAG